MTTVPWHRSLALRVFGLMSLCLSAAVGVVAWQQGGVLYDYLNRQLEDSTVAQSTELAASLSATLKHWKSIANIVVTRMSGTSVEGYAAFIGSFVGSESGLEGIWLLEAGGAKPPSLIVAKARTGGLLAESRRSKAVEAFALSWLESTARSPRQGDLLLAVRDLTGPAGVPLMAVASQYHVSGQSRDLWVVLAVARPEAIAKIPAERAIQAIVLNQELKPVFYSANAAGGLTRDLPPVVDAIRRAKSDFGFKAFRGAQGGDLLVAFNALKEFGLVTVVTQSAEGARVAIRSTLVRSLLLAWLAMLVALLLTYVAAYRVTRHLKAVTAATQRIAGGDFTTDLVVTGRDEVAALANSVNSMSAQIRDLLASKVEAARQEKELETARLVQMTLFPKDVFRDETLAIGGVCHPASECGGDLWGHAAVGQDRHYIFIADATGHGASAALVTAIVYAQWETMADEMAAGAEPLSPSVILERMSRLLWRSGAGTTTMTLFLGCLNRKTGAFVFASAGHNPPLLVPSSESDERFTAGFGDESRKSATRRFHHHKLNCRGDPLGMTPGSTYVDRELRVAAGDRLLLYTDGLIECTSPDGKQWGEKKFRTTVDSTARIEVSAFYRQICADAFEHFQDQPRADDVTVVVLEVAPTWLAQAPGGPSPALAG